MSGLRSDYRMHFDRFTLRFSGQESALEEPFLRYYSFRSLWYARFALVMGAVLVGLFGILDSYLAPNHAQLLWFIRYAILCPVTLLIALLTFHKRLVPLLPVFHVFILLLTAAGFTAMILYSPPPVNYLYYSGLLLVLIYGYTFLRLRFIWGTLAGWMIVGMYFIAAVQLAEIPVPILLNNFFFLVTMNLIGMMASYAMEYYARKDFFLMTKMKKAQEEVEETNALLESRVEERTAQLQENNAHLSREISERIAVEEALRDSERRFRTLYENSVIGLYRTTADGRVLLANPTLVKMLGYSSFEELQAKNLETEPFEPSYERRSFREQIEAGGEIQDLESVWTRKDGSVIYVKECARALRDANGATLYYDGTVEDITDRKRLEQQLLQSQKLEGVGTLAGGIAHDFNNLLAMVLGSAELLLQQLEEHPELQKYAQRIIEASERGTSISRQLLIFSRPGEAELKPILLAHAITELKNMLAHFLPKSISIITNECACGRSILGDAGQIHQALLNLVLNAGDAMEHGGTLTISEYCVAPDAMKKLFSLAEPGDYIAVSIADTGVGMDEATRQRIFDPFFTTKPPGKGTGLGLGIVHGIVKTHNGMINVESTPGAGTTFTLYFPAFARDEHAEPAAGHRPEPPRHGTILVVDDEPLLRDMLFEYLDGSGFTVYVACGGAEALEVYRTKKDAIDLVITDLGMPGMGGRELYQRLRALDDSVKVMVASGYLDGITRDHLLEAGIKGVVQKPYRLHAIRDEIIKVLGSARERAEQ